jgi:hypothetical protein
MGAKAYYQDNSNPLYVDVLDIVLESLILYMFKLIYPDEEYNAENVKKRFILVDFESGDEVAIRRSIETNFSTNATFPFTGYNIGDEELIPQYSHLQKTGTYYDPILNMHLAVFPYITTFPMTTFFNTAFDWRRINIRVNFDDIVLNRLFVPCTINGVLTQFPVDFDFEVSKGTYSFRYDEFLKTGRIYDFTHNVRVMYHKIVGVLPSNASPSGKQEPLRIYPVDNIELALKELNDKTMLDNPINYSIGNFNVPDAPQIASSIPSNNAVGVDVTSDIVFQFNVALNELSLRNNISVIPFFEFTTILSVNGKVLTINPVSDLTPTTKYEITLGKTIMSVDNIFMTDNYDLIFSTL